VGCPTDTATGTQCAESPRLSRSSSLHTCAAAALLLLQNLPATLGRLLELLQQQYPAAIAPSSVWGYGQPLWDAGRRVYGEHPLRLVLLGPAACGKSTQGALLAKRWGVGHGGLVVVRVPQLYSISQCLHLHGWSQASAHVGVLLCHMAPHDWSPLAVMALT
jgi:hypothetical protein